MNIMISSYIEKSIRKFQILFWEYNSGSIVFNEWKNSSL